MTSKSFSFLALPPGTIAPFHREYSVKSVPPFNPGSPSWREGGSGKGFCSIPSPCIQFKVDSLFSVFSLGNISLKMNPKFTKGNMQIFQFYLYETYIKQELFDPEFRFIFFLI